MSRDPRGPTRRPTIGAEEAQESAAFGLWTTSPGRARHGLGPTVDAVADTATHVNFTAETAELRKRIAVNNSAPGRTVPNCGKRLRKLRILRKVRPPVVRSVPLASGSAHCAPARNGRQCRPRALRTRAGAAVQPVDACGQLARSSSSMAPGDAAPPHVWWRTWCPVSRAKDGPPQPHPGARRSASATLSIAGGAGRPSVPDARRRPPGQGPGAAQGPAGRAAMGIRPNSAQAEPPAQTGALGPVTRLRRPGSKTSTCRP